MSFRGTCPSCGGEVELRSPASVSAVCAYCGSVVVRTDTAVEAIGRVAAVLADVTPFQVGTTARLDGRGYTVLGRLRMQWQDGGWNEWFLDADGGPAWLAEAQGTLAMLSESPVPDECRLGFPALGDRVCIDGLDYRVSDLRDARCVGGEGELPFPLPDGRTIRSADMVASTGGFANLTEDGKDRRFFTGRYVDFDSLDLADLRDIDGWKPPVPYAGPTRDPAFPFS